MSSDDTEPRGLSNLPYRDDEDVSRILNIRAVNRTNTYLDTPPAQSAINEFMSFTYSIEHYKALAERAQKLLGVALKGARDFNKVEVQFRITCRAKSAKSLREKLEVRNRERNYQTPRDILEDLKDLAGVRVVLYTPNKAQRLRVKEAIKEIWSDKVEERLHGDPISSRKANLSQTDDDNDSDSDNNDEDDVNTATDDDEEYVPRHVGYQADHYNVLMLPEQGDDPYEYKELDRVEIQVVSALGHVWAEAGHDVMYKTHTFGNPTMLEHRILDALSGLITSGDLLLEEFRESVTKRTYARWKHPEELAMWLRESDVMKHKERKNGKVIHTSLDNHFAAAGIDILYRFLRKTDKNYPIAVRDVLKPLGFPKAPASGLDKELERFGSGFRPPHGLLAPFCVLSRLMSRAPLEVGEHDVHQKCSTMMDAFILLQTFSGTAAAAKEYLLVNVKQGLDEEQKESIDFVLNDPLRRDCFKKVKGNSEDLLAQELQASWDWFVQQSTDDKLCGFFFRLAVMGIPAKEMGFSERLEKLAIKSLSRANTFEDDNEYR
jgi:ppGpp synthetase/RelA/SpoT-type nucleotidyltranferase